jgi:hypothetical protein
MSVITTDALIVGIRRDDVMAWLGQPTVHARFLTNGFEVQTRSDTECLLTLRMPGRSIDIGYHFDKIDETHGGRRVLCSTSGKRAQGKLRYSLRTMKPAKNTLITLHHDYKSGRLLGPLLDAAGTRKALEAAWAEVIQGLVDEIQRELGA